MVRDDTLVGLAVDATAAVLLERELTEATTAGTAAASGVRGPGWPLVPGAVAAGAELATDEAGSQGHIDFT